MKQVSNFQRKLISSGNPVKQHFPKLSLSRPIPSTQAAQHAWAGKQPLKALWQARRGSWHLQSTLSTSELGWAEIRASPLSSGCAVTVHPCYNQAKSKQNLLFEIWDDFSVLYTANQSHGTRTLHSRDSLALPNASGKSQEPWALLCHSLGFFQASQSICNGISDSRPGQRNFTLMCDLNQLCCIPSFSSFDASSNLPRKRCLHLPKMICFLWTSPHLIEVKQSTCDFKRR